MIYMWTVLESPYHTVTWTLADNKLKWNHSLETTVIISLIALLSQCWHEIRCSLLNLRRTWLISRTMRPISEKNAKYQMWDASAAWGKWLNSVKIRRPILYCDQNLLETKVDFCTVSQHIVFWISWSVWTNKHICKTFVYGHRQRLQIWIAIKSFV